MLYEERIESFLKRCNAKTLAGNHCSGVPAEEGLIFCNLHYQIFLNAVNAKKFAESAPEDDTDASEEESDVNSISSIDTQVSIYASPPSSPAIMPASPLVYTHGVVAREEEVMELLWVTAEEKALLPTQPAALLPNQPATYTVPAKQPAAHSSSQPVTHTVPATEPVAHSPSQPVTQTVPARQPSEPTTSSYTEPEFTLPRRTIQQSAAYTHTQSWLARLMSKIRRALEKTHNYMILHLGI